ncbi:EamA family transporter [Chitinilyticum litopenaei]|uniref:EamA family transporter n=1 Tax=Chitinilyticum litopenaei TaxID=1121276 RepID=UPI00040C9B60|nr:EamA family transporter [Chitinilyticum litopenaei]
MTTSPLRQFALPVLLTALAPLIWGSTYLVTTELLPADRPLTAALLRTLPAGLLLLLASRQRDIGWPRLLLLAALNIGGFQALLFIAAYRLPGGLAAVLGAIQPLLVLGLAWSMDGQRPHWQALLACCTGLAGMALMLLTPDSRADQYGIAAALAGAACMATGTFLARRWQGATPLLAYTGWQLVLGGLLLLPAALWLEPALPRLGWPALAGYAYLCLCGAALAYVLWFRGVALLPPVALSVLGLLSPLCAVLLGWLVLGQALRGQALLGMALVLASIVAVQFASAGWRKPH